MRPSFARLSVLFALLVVLSSGVAAQTTRHVPADYPTIQAAINAAVNGDTVLVAPGTYNERINFFGKAITVASSGGRDVTTIDGGQIDSVVTFLGLEGMQAALRGFTIQNGLGTSYGGGISIHDGSLVVEDNKIVNNQSCSGAAIYVGWGSSIVRRNLITHNVGSCYSHTRAVSVRAPDSFEFRDNLITDNSTTGPVLQMLGGVAAGNTIRNNTSTGGEVLVLSTASFVNNVVFGNSAALETIRVLWLNQFLNNTIDGSSNPLTVVRTNHMASGAQMANNIIVAAPGIAAVHCESPAPSTAVFRNNNLVGGAAGFAGHCANQTGQNGNFSADPLFVDSAQGDYRLRVGSPSVDAGSDQVGPLPSTDAAGLPRNVDGNGDGVSLPDQGAHELGAQGTTTIVLSDTALSFGAHRVGSTNSVLSVTVTNTGSNPSLFRACSPAATSHKVTPARQAMWPRAPHALFTLPLHRRRRGRVPASSCCLGTFSQVHPLQASMDSDWKRSSPSHRHLSVSGPPMSAKRVWRFP